MNNTIGIVLINGAGLNSSVWNTLKQKIDNPVLSIEFPNRMTDGKSNKKLTFDDYINTAIAEIKNWRKDDFIIVAHSIGACVGLTVAEHFKKELQGFIAIGSVIPKSGQSFVSSLPLPQRLLLPILLTLFGTKPPEKSIEAELCNDLNRETTASVVSEFTPESKRLYTTKIRFELPDTKRLYIKLTNDKSIPIDFQEKMAQNLRATEIESINSGHLPMLSKPDELTRILADFIKNIKTANVKLNG